MINNFKISQYSYTQSSSSINSNKIQIACQQSEQSQQFILYYLISDKFKSIARVIEHNKYWHVFEAFKKITTTLKPYELRKIRSNKLKQLSFKHLKRRNIKIEQMQNAFNKFRQNIRIDSQVDACLEKTFFIIINRRYVQIARFFSILKTRKKQQSFMAIMEREEQIEEEQDVIQNQIIKIQNRNKKNIINFTCCQIKNIITPIIIQRAYAAFWQKVRSNSCIAQQAKCNKIQASVSQKQRAKFMKKSTQFNQVQILSKIIIDGFQIKSVQKGMYQSIQKINKFIFKQEIKSKRNLLATLKKMYIATSAKQNNKVIIKENPQSENDLIYTNVLSNLCYLSKKIQVQFVQRTPKKKLTQQKLDRIFQLLKKKNLHHLIYGFGSIKMQNFNYKMSLWRRIQQLEEIKQKYFEYYNETEYQEQQQENKELNF